MSDKPSKYCRAISRHLLVLATPNDVSLDYVQAYEDFVDLWDEEENAHKRKELTEQQRKSVDAVLDSIMTIVYRPDSHRLGTSQALRGAPEWEPMREAARAALKELE